MGWVHRYINVYWFLWVSGLKIMNLMINELQFLSFDIQCSKIKIHFLHSQICPTASGTEKMTNFHLLWLFNCYSLSMYLQIFVVDYASVKLGWKSVCLQWVNISGYSLITRYSQCCDIFELMYAAIMPNNAPIVWSLPSTVLELDL